jgi:uncharacterized protein YggE
MKMQHLACPFLLAAVGLSLCAQPAPLPSGPGVVEASGEAVVYAKPDQAKIDIGVVSQAPTAQAAAAQNASEAKSVIDKLRSLLGSAGQIRTISYSVAPDYQYPKPGGKPTISAYSATNVVEVTTDDLENVGKLIDIATQGGANQIRQLQFQLKNESAARQQALREAVQTARGNAEAMASAMGLKLGKVVKLQQESTSTPPRPVFAAMARMESAQPTPVESGTIEIRASVSLTVALEQ